MTALCSVDSSAAAVASLPPTASAWAFDDVEDSDVSGDDVNVELPAAVIVGADGGGNGLENFLVAFFHKVFSGLFLIRPVDLLLLLLLSALNFIGSESTKGASSDIVATAEASVWLTSSSSSSFSPCGETFSIDSSLVLMASVASSSSSTSSASSKGEPLMYTVNDLVH